MSQQEAPPGFDLDAILAAMGKADGYLDITPADALELYRLAWEHASGVRAGLPVRRFMTSPAVAAQSTLPATELARLLAAHGISGAPVVSGDEVVGVVSIKDFLPRLGLEKDATSITLVSELVSGSLCPGIDLSGVTAGDLMTAPALTVGPDTPVGETARLMEDAHINRLPVVENGRLVGIITRGDVLSACRVDPPASEI